MITSQLTTTGTHFLPSLLHIRFNASATFALSARHELRALHEIAHPTVPILEEVDQRALEPMMVHGAEHAAHSPL